MILLPDVKPVEAFFRAAPVLSDTRTYVRVDSDEKLVYKYNNGSCTNPRQTTSKRSKGLSKLVSLPLIS